MALLATLMCGATAAGASMVLYMPPRDLAGHAGLIFAGTVTGSRPEKVRGTVITYVVFRDLRLAKGTATGDSVLLALEGGTVGNDLIVVTGQPNFEVGNRYVLFVLPDRGPGKNSLTPVVGLYQGYFKVERLPGSRGSIVLDGLLRPVVRISPDQVTVVMPDSLFPAAIRERMIARGNADSLREARWGLEHRNRGGVLREPEDPGTRVSEEEFLEAVRGFSQ